MNHNDNKKRFQVTTRHWCSRATIATLRPRLSPCLQTTCHKRASQNLISLCDIELALFCVLLMILCNLNLSVHGFAGQLSRSCK